MKKLLLALLIVLVYSSCKQEKKDSIDAKPMTIAERIAFTHGFEHWHKVSEINFTFNIDRDTSHYERSWSWKPKRNDITLITNTDTISYNRSNMDSIAIKADKRFINDKFWLLVPFQLIWDESAKISDPTKENAPISNTLQNKITLTYSNQGGYTPGDAYDIYYNDDFLIKEWIYRASNSNAPTMTTTFEDYIDFNGIKIAKSHKKKAGSWNLNFTNIKISLEEH